MILITFLRFIALLLLLADVKSFRPTSPLWKTSSRIKSNSKMHEMSPSVDIPAVVVNAEGLLDGNKWKIDPKTKTLQTSLGKTVAGADQSQCNKVVLIKHLGNMTHADLLQLLLLECGGVDESDVQYSVDYFSGVRFAMVHYPSKESAEKVVKVLRKYDWKFSQRITLLPNRIAKYLSNPFVAENNLYVGNVTCTDEAQFREVITEILGHDIVDCQIIQGGVKGVGQHRGVYVVLKSAEEANRAFEKLTGRMFMGNVMYVQRVSGVETAHPYTLVKRYKPGFGPPSVPSTVKTGDTEGSVSTDSLAQGHAEMENVKLVAEVMQVIDAMATALSSKITSVVPNSHKVIQSPTIPAMEAYNDIGSSLWLSSNRTVLITASDTSLLADDNLSRDNALVAARLLDICHIVVGVNTVSNMNVTQNGEDGSVAFIQFIDSKTATTALRTLQQWYESKRKATKKTNTKNKIVVEMTDVLPSEASALTTQNYLLDKITLYIKNVPASLKKLDLGHLILETGVHYRETGFGCITRNSINSYAEVTFDSLTDAVKCLTALQGKQLQGKELKVELSALLMDHVEEDLSTPATEVDKTATTLMQDVEQFDPYSAWLASNRTILIQGLVNADPEAVYDHCHMALGVNAITNMNVSHDQQNVSQVYIQIRDAVQLHHSIDHLKKRFRQINMKADVMKTNFKDEVSACRCVTVDPFKNQHVVYLRNIAPTVVKQDIADLCRINNSVPLTVKFGCHKKKSDHYFAQLTFRKLSHAINMAQHLNGTTLKGSVLRVEVSALRYHDGTGVEAPRRPSGQPAESFIAPSGAAVEPVSTWSGNTVKWFGLHQASKATEINPTNTTIESRTTNLEEWIQYNRTVLLKNVPSMQTIVKMRKDVQFGQLKKVYDDATDSDLYYLRARDAANAAKIVAYCQSKRFENDTITATILRDPNVPVEVVSPSPKPALVVGAEKIGATSINNKNEVYSYRDMSLIIKDLDTKVTEEELIALCENIVDQKNCVRGVHFFMRNAEERGDGARVFLDSMDVTRRAQILLDGKKVGDRKVIVRMAEYVDYDDDACKFVLRNIHPAATIYSLWTNIEKTLGTDTVKDMRTYIRYGQMKSVTVFTRSAEIASNAIEQLSRVRYRGLRLQPERFASKDSIVLLRPIDDRATQSEVLRMVQYLVGSDSVENLSIEQAEDNVTNAIIVFRNRECTERALKQLQGRTFYGRPLIVEHVVVPKKDRSTTATVNEIRVNATPDTISSAVPKTILTRLREIVKNIGSTLRSLFRL